MKNSGSAHAVSLIKIVFFNLSAHRTNNTVSPSLCCNQGNTQTTATSV